MLPFVTRKYLRVYVNPPGERTKKTTTRNQAAKDCELRLDDPHGRRRHLLPLPRVKMRRWFLSRCFKLLEPRMVRLDLAVEVDRSSRLGCILGNCESAFESIRDRLVEVV